VFVNAQPVIAPSEFPVIRSMVNGVEQMLNSTLVFIPGKTELSRVSRMVLHIVL